MRRTGWIFLVILCSAGFLLSQSSNSPMNSGQSMRITGTVCQSSCVSRSGDLATCDPTCTTKSGEMVLVDDQGNVRQISNQDMCKSHLGKHVKVTAMSGDTDPRSSLRIMELVDEY